MNWQKVKWNKQIILEGITADVDHSDTTLVAVTLTDAKGNKLRIRYESYVMHAEVPAAPKTVEKIALNGTVLGLPVAEIFDDKYKAEDRKEELTGRLDVVDRLLVDLQELKAARDGEGA